MAFDAREYRSRVLSHYSRGKARFLADAIREMKQDQNRKVPSQFNLVEFYDVRANPTDAALAGHIDAVVSAIKAGVTKPGGSKQPLELHELIAARNTDLKTTQFWRTITEQQTQRAQELLKEFAKNTAADFSALRVVTAERLREASKKAGIHNSVTDAELVQAMQSEGVSVVPDFPAINVAAEGVRREILAPLQTTSARSVLTVVFLRKSKIEGDLEAFSILDGFRTSTPGYSLTTSSLSDSVEYQGKLPDSHETNVFGKVLTALSRVKSDAELQEVVTAYFIELGKEIFKNSGGPSGALRMFVSQTGLDTVDAGRILLQVVPSGGAQQRTYADVQSLIAAGALKEARRLYGALVAEQAGSESDLQKKALAALEGTEQKVEQLRRRAASAQTSGDLETAAKALNEALTICSDDEALSAAARALPPAAPVRFIASISEDARTTKLSWEPGFGSSEDVRYQVIRKVGSPPLNNTDGTPIGAPTAATTLEDARPPVAVKLFYGVSASRGGGSSPVATAEVMALPPVTEIVVVSDPSSVTLRWTTPPEVSSIEVIQSAPDGSTTSLRPGTQSGTTSTGLRMGTTYTYLLTAFYIGATGERLKSTTQRVTGVPRGIATPVTELSITAQPTTGSKPEVAVEWAPVEGYAVEIWHYAQKPSWLPGTRLAMAEIRTQGSQVAGRALANGGREGVQGATSKGLRYFVAITRDGDLGLVGASRPFGSAPPVQNLRVERFGEEAVLSWDWPGDEYQVRVKWSGATNGERTIAMSEYHREGGCRISIGSSGGTVTVASVAGEGDTQWVSSETSLAVAGAEQTIAYDVEFQRKLFAPPSGATLTFKIPSETKVDVIIVGHFSKFMPFDASQGSPLQRTTVSPESPQVVVSIPRGSGPVWVRAFTSTPGVRLDDPPTSRMKVG